MNNILVVVDMQNDFVTDALRNEEAIKIIPNVVEKIKAAHADGDFVIFTRDTHYENYMDTEEGRNLPVPHCIKDTNGWEIIDELKPLVEECGERVLDKDTFGSTMLGSIVKSYVYTNPIQEVQLIGLCTDICVISNAMVIKAFCPNIPISVDAACCAGVTPESHDNALNAMKTCHVRVDNMGNEPWRN